MTGLHISGVWRKPAALELESCDRFHITNCTILDSDNTGLLLKDVTNTRVAGCVIRDDRPEKKPGASLKAVGGKGNWILHNLLAAPADIAPGIARVEGNYDGK